MSQYPFFFFLTIHFQDFIQSDNQNQNVKKDHSWPTVYSINTNQIIVFIKGTAENNFYTINLFYELIYIYFLITFQSGFQASP